MPWLQYDESFGFDQVIDVRSADYGAFKDRGMRNKTVFDFYRRNPDASHLQHVIAASHVVVESFFVLVVLVVSVYPFAQDGGFCLLVLVPVSCADAVPL